MTQERIFGMAAAAMLAACAGCANWNMGGSPQVVDASNGAPRAVDPVPDLVAQSRPPIADLPVPIGFELDQGKSRNYTLAGARLVDHVYKGSGNKVAIKQFYERQMPVCRWSLVTAMFVQGEISMDFERENERCHLTITDTGWFNNVQIKVFLTTSGRVELPPGPTRTR